MFKSTMLLALQNRLDILNLRFLAVADMGVEAAPAARVAARRAEVAREVKGTTSTMTTMTTPVTRDPTERWSTHTRLDSLTG